MAYDWRASNTKLCLNAVGKFPSTECCDWTPYEDKDGNRTRKYKHCRYILECKKAKIEPTLMPKLLGYEPEDKLDVSYNDSIRKAVMDICDSKIKAGRVGTICEEMGVASVEKLKSMPDEWMGYLPKVNKLGSGVLSYIKAVRGSES